MTIDDGGVIWQSAFRSCGVVTGPYDRGRHAMVPVVIGAGLIPKSDLVVALSLAYVLNVAPILRFGIFRSETRSLGTQTKRKSLKFDCYARLKSLGLAILVLLHELSSGIWFPRLTIYLTQGLFGVAAYSRCLRSKCILQEDRGKIQSSTLRGEDTPEGCRVMIRSETAKICSKGVTRTCAKTRG